MAAARFRVIGRFDKAKIQEATVTVDRAAGLFSVKPLHRRRDYTLPLSTVAEIVVVKIIKSELSEKVAAKRAAKLAKKRTRKRG